MTDPELGVSLSGEEHGPNALVDTAVRAEEAGFSFALASDHYHPWIDAQGNNSFVWTTLGGIARETSSLRVGTGVACPTIRVHPAIVAQATATVAEMMDGRFFFGVGTGENLNEHVLGDRWPPHGVRLEMMEEAVEIIRNLWSGETYNHHGRHYTVEDAKLYTLPDRPPSVYVAAGGPRSAAAAGRIGDGLVSTAPDDTVVQRFEEAAEDGSNLPKYGQITTCWAESEEEGRKTAYEHWPNAAIGGELGQILPTPAHFEQAAEMVSEEDVAEVVVCGPDADAHVEMIQKYADAGFDHVSIHQVGPNQKEAIEFYESEVLPSFDG
jgi:G6PDH family F420-dependent oxidoreductase